MNRRRLLAGAVWTLSWVFACAAIAVLWLADLPSTPLPGVFLSPAPEDVRSSFDLIGITVALIYGPVGALLLARRATLVGAIVAIHAIGSGIAAFGVQWGLLGAQHPGLPLWGFFAFAAGWGYVPGTFMTAALPLLITRSRLALWQRLTVVLCAAVAGVAWFASLTQQSVPVPTNPFAIPSPSYQMLVAPLYTSMSFVAVGISVVSCAVLIGRWARSRDGRSRTGWAWLTLGHIFLTLSYFALVLPADLAVPRWLVEFGMIAPIVGQVLYPAAILVVVLGQKLWGVEIVLSRITLWAMLSVTGIGVYLVVVVAAPRLLPASDGVWIVAPLAVALAIQPLRRWLQRRIDQLVYGQGADPEALLLRLSDRIGELDPGIAGLTELAEALRDVLRLDAVQIRSEAAGIVVRTGPTGARSVTVPLLSGSNQLGELVVTPLGAQRLDRRTLEVLRDVSGLIAAAISLVDLNRRLGRSREELVALRAEERRALRRELHDSLGPALAGIGFGLAAVENLVHTDRVRALALLDELHTDVQRRVRDVRMLADEMDARSPLDGSSLADAVSELAQRFTQPHLIVESCVDVRGPIRPDVQDAAYFIAAEALANAVRHAHARRIDVHIQTQVRDSSPTLRVSVQDDGVGVHETHGHGVGLVSMRERALRLGGSLRIESAEASDAGDVTPPARVQTAGARRTAGTRVIAELPCESVPTDSVWIEDIVH